MCRRARASTVRVHTHTHACGRARTHAHTDTHSSHTHTRARTHTSTRTHTHARAGAHTLRFCSAAWGGGAIPRRRPLLRQLPTAMQPWVSLTCPENQMRGKRSQCELKGRSPLYTRAHARHARTRTHAHAPRPLTQVLGVLANTRRFTAREATFAALTRAVRRSRPRMDPEDDPELAMAIALSLAEVWGVMRRLAIWRSVRPSGLPSN